MWIVDKAINEARKPWTLYSGNLWFNTGIPNMLHKAQVSTPKAVLRRLLKYSPESGKKIVMS